MPESTARLPVTVIAGYLGAGKTTLVNHLLRHPGGRKLVVLVNDFGELPIDAVLIEARSSDMLTLANGCVCCSVGGDLYNALVTVLERRAPADHLVIEASGVARPSRIANVARAEPDLSLDAVVTLVDAEHCLQHLADPLLADSVAGQIAAADLVLLNKTDLVDAARRRETAARIAALNPSASVLGCVAAVVPTDAVLGGGGAFAAPGDDDGHDHEAAYRRWSHERAGRFDRARLERALAAMPANVLRVKGVVRVAGDEAPLVVQRVGRRVTVERAPPSLGSVDISRIVAIARQAGFDPALLDRLIEGAGAVDRR